MLCNTAPYLGCHVLPRPAYPGLNRPRIAERYLDCLDLPRRALPGLA